jgi:hypothetical protein
VFIVVRLVLVLRSLRIRSVVDMDNDLELCVNCRRPFAIRFNGVGFYFHWVKNHYFVDVVFFVVNYPLVLFREVWVLDAKGAKAT